MPPQHRARAAMARKGSRERAKAQQDTTYNAKSRGRFHALRARSSNVGEFQFTPPRRGQFLPRSSAIPLVERSTFKACLIGIQPAEAEAIMAEDRWS